MPRGSGLEFSYCSAASVAVRVRAAPSRCVSPSPPTISLLKDALWSKLTSPRKP